MANYYFRNQTIELLEFCLQVHPEGKTLKLALQDYYACGEQEVIAELYRRWKNQGSLDSVKVLRWGLYTSFFKHSTIKAMDYLSDLINTLQERIEGDNS